MTAGWHGGLDVGGHALHMRPLQHGSERCRAAGSTSRRTGPNGTLYTGVTSNIARRAWEHREGVIEGFTKKYGLTRIVYAERHDDIRTAIQREKTIKHWTRTWKVALILETNPSWGDLYNLLS